MKPRPRHPLPSHAFVYRAGIALSGTPITCDALGFASDLIFLSHARALTPQGPARLASQRAGRRQIITTERTLRLLGDAGNKLRDRTLPAAFGRPFNLGEHRIEVVPTGHLPGSAALLCEGQGKRFFYLGAFCPEAFVDGVEAAEVRAADAVCIDASFADERCVFPPRKQVLADLRAFAERTLAEGLTPTLLASPFGALPAVAHELAQAGLALRAHPRIVSVLARLRGRGDTAMALHRFAGKVGAREVLLWPPEARDAAALLALDNLRLALVSGSAYAPEILARMRLAHGFVLTNMPSRAEILSAIEAVGAREVALFHGAADSLAQTLRAKGLDAYVVGPPRQMTLPVGN